MDTLAECSITHLVPAAPGWHAQYHDGSRTNLAAVALWALVSSDAGGRRIVGIAPGPAGMSCHAEEAPNFDRYVFVSASTTAVPGARAV